MNTFKSYSWFQTFAVFCMLYVSFRVIPRRLNFIYRRFGTLCLFHLLAYEDGTECSETSANKIQTPGNYPKESIQQQCTSPHCKHCKKYTALRSDFSAVLNWFTRIRQIPILKSFLVSAELFEVNLFISGNSNNNFRWRSTRMFPPLPTNKHAAFMGANRRSARSGCVHN
jgi:hypothetical protein